MVKRAAWLSVTPEPERELPAAVATLTCGAAPAPAAVERERQRIERLILRGSQRRWLAYLHEVAGLIRQRSAGALSDPVAAAEVGRARRRAAIVLANHHNLLLGLPGRGAALAAEDRRELELVADEPGADAA